MDVLGNAVRVPFKSVPPANGYESLLGADPSADGDFAQLRSFIAPFLDGFAVTDEASRKALAELAGSGGLGNVEFLERFIARSLRDDNNVDVTLYKKLLSLGIDFSHPVVQKALSEHRATFTHLWPLLLKTRVDIGTYFDDSATCHPSVINIGITLRRIARLWHEQSVRAHGIHGDATIAQLAYDGDFYAVLNLIRHNAVPFSEFQEKHRGRDVVEWAGFHGQHPLVMELLGFRYPFLMARDPPPKPSAANPDRLDPIVMMERLQEKFDALVKENETTKQELAHIKEYLDLDSRG